MNTGAQRLRGRHGSRLGQPGIVLILVVLMVGLFLVMGVSLINMASSDYQIASNESQNIQALYNGDAGTEEAKMRLSPNAPGGVYNATTNPGGKGIPVGTSADWRAYLLSGHNQAEIQNGLDSTYGKAPPNYTTTESTSNYSYYTTVQPGGILWGWARIQLMVNSVGSIVYSDAVTGQDTPLSSQVVNGTTVYNPPNLIVTTEGIQGAIRRMISMEFRPIIRTTTASNDVVTKPFNDAAHGGSGVTLSGGAYTDSYNSDSGAYTPSPSITNRGTSGNVSVDSTASGSVTVASGSAINGNVQVGPGGTSAAVTNQGAITGTVTAESAAMNMPLSTIPSGVTNLGALNISNGIRTLTEGTYWFSSISISGTGMLQTSGEVKIYVTGSISIAGNGVGTAGNEPEDLLIYGTVDPNNSANKCTSVSVSGNGKLYGAIYAPAASIAVSGNAEVFGSLTGASVTLSGNGGLHYDTQLSNLGRFVTTTYTTTYTTTGFSRYSWREIAF